MALQDRRRVCDSRRRLVTPPVPVCLYSVSVHVYVFLFLDLKLIFHSRRTTDWQTVAGPQAAVLQL